MVSLTPSHESLCGPPSDSLSSPPDHQWEQMSHEKQNPKNYERHLEAGIVPWNHSITDSERCNVLDSVEHHHDRVEASLVDIKQIGEEDGGG